MIALCLVLLVGGSPAAAPPRPAAPLPELRLHPAVVVSPEALALETAEAAAALDPAVAGAPGTAASPAGQVPLRKAAVVRAPAPTKEP